VTRVPLTVNGTDVTLDAEPRTTLADALRRQLRLTGTHLGCEHGVCGACTVVVDGSAVRSCLLFAVQAAGADVLTVEGLGTPDRLHPLQRAFMRNHGLQCGFCTSGFLMSSYDLLREGLGADDGRIAQELSGVLCRCTGYRGVVDAVREVARDHPDGVPEPLNLGVALTVVDPGGPGVEEPEPAPVLPQAERLDLSEPGGEPTAAVDVSTELSAAPERAWELLSDLPRASRCLPGVELTDDQGNGVYGGTARLQAGPVGLELAGAARVVERDDSARTIRAVAVGEDRGGGGVRAYLEFQAQPADAGSRFLATARLHLSGRAARFGRSIAGDVSRELFEEFGRCVERTLSGEEPAARTKLKGGRLAARALRARAGHLWRGLIDRLRRR
jgi:aerobic-type carbon monoxide dehydrogenase small subunit (CoxS/CutS family)/carbon monoxide dehydrogenase subunit G